MKQIFFNLTKRKNPRVLKLESKVSNKRQKDPGEKPETNDAHEQSLRFGKDLARLYKEEKQKREELQASNQTLREVFSMSPDGLIILDDRLVIQQPNPTFANWFDVSEDSLIGESLLNLFPRQEIGKPIPKTSTFNEMKFEAQLLISRPIKRNIHARFVSITQGNSRGWLAVMHDETAQKRIDLQKDEFLEIAAHELRTPLIPIIGTTELLLKLLKGRVDEKESRFLEDIQSGGHDLLNIVNNLLDFASTNQGHYYQRESATISINDLCLDVIAELRSQAAEAQVDIILEISPKDIQVITYPGLLRRALYHLVQNGIKFNVVGGNVKIKVQDKKETVTIQIIDDGIGIPKGELENIFNPLFQVEGHLTRKNGGLGVGMAIASRAVEQLNGTLAIESQVGKGSTCTIRFDKEIVSKEQEISSLQERLGSSQKQSLAYAKDITSLYKQLQNLFIETIDAAVQAIEAKDAYTRGHTERVTNYSVQIGHKMGLSKQALVDLGTAGRIHDIGKIGIPDAILNKPDRLTEQEFEIIKSHVQIGRDIMQPMEFLNDIAPIAFSHHERWDGKGYPDGLKGAEIPIGGRIMAVADAFDAMTSDRPYRKGMPKQKAVSILQEGAGTQWDPEIVSLFSELMIQAAAKK